MTALTLDDGVLGGIVAWHSIIHVPQEQLPGVFAELHRVLAPGGHVQLAFQAGDELARRTEALGRPISLDTHHRQRDAAGPPAKPRCVCGTAHRTFPNRSLRATSAPQRR